MPPSKLKIIGYVVGGLLWVGSVAQAAGQTTLLSRLTPDKSAEPAIRQPIDVLDYLPLIRQIRIPRLFIFEGGYRVKLNGDNMTIDHMVNTESIPTSKKICTLSVSYGSQFGAGFNSRVDIPLFHASRLGLFNWKPSPIGDYVARFGAGSSDSTTRTRNTSSVTLLAAAKF